MSPPREQDVTPDNLRRLTAIHLKRYGGRLAGKAEHPETPLGRAVNVHECFCLFVVWFGVMVNEYDWKRMDPAQRQEIEEALAAGE